jgi:hypothetical protein
MLVFSHNQITDADELNECRMSNKVYPPSAAPEATREYRMTKFDGLAKGQQTLFSVIPAKAGIQRTVKTPGCPPARA